MANPIQYYHPLPLDHFYRSKTSWVSFRHSHFYVQSSPVPTLNFFFLQLENDY